MAAWGGMLRNMSPDATDSTKCFVRPFKLIYSFVINRTTEGTLTMYPVMFGNGFQAPQAATATAVRPAFGRAAEKEIPRLGGDNGIKVTYHGDGLPEESKTKSPPYRVHIVSAS